MYNIHAMASYFIFLDLLSALFGSTSPGSTEHHVFRIRQWSSFLWMFLTQAAGSTMLLPSLPRGMAAEVEIKNDPQNLR